MTVETAGFVSLPAGRWIAASEALLRIRGHDGSVETVLVGQRQIRPRGRSRGATGRHAVRSSRVQLNVGRVADGDRRHVLIARHAIERGRRWSSGGRPVLAGGVRLRVRVRSGPGPVQRHLRSRRAWLLVVKRRHAARPSQRGRQRRVALHVRASRGLDLNYQSRLTEISTVRTYVRFGAIRRSSRLPAALRSFFFLFLFVSQNYDYERLHRVTERENSSIVTISVGD